MPTKLRRLLKIQFSLRRFSRTLSGVVVACLGLNTNTLALGEPLTPATSTPPAAISSSGAAVTADPADPADTRTGSASTPSGGPAVPGAREPDPIEAAMTARRVEVNDVSSAVASAMSVKVSASGKELSEEDFKKFNEAMKQLKVNCLPTFERNARTILSRTRTDLWIALGGAAAGLGGSVVAAAKGSAILASIFSGSSGVVNGIQTSLSTDGFSVEAARKNSGDMRAKFDAAMTDYVNAYDSDLDARLKARKMQASILRAELACFTGGMVL